MSFRKHSRLSGSLGHFRKVNRYSGIGIVIFLLALLPLVTITAQRKTQTRQKAATENFQSTSTSKAYFDKPPYRQQGGLSAQSGASEYSLYYSPPGNGKTRFQPVVVIPKDFLQMKGLAGQENQIGIIMRGQLRGVLDSVESNIPGSHFIVTDNATVITLDQTYSEIICGTTIPNCANPSWDNFMQVVASAYQGRKESGAMGVIFALGGAGIAYGLTDSDHVFIGDWGFSRLFGYSYADCATNCDVAGFRWTLAHELGHGFGIATHSPPYVGTTVMSSWPDVVVYANNKYYPEKWVICNNSLNSTPSCSGLESPYLNTHALSGINGNINVPNCLEYKTNYLVALTENPLGYFNRKVLATTPLNANGTFSFGSRTILINEGWGGYGFNLCQTGQTCDEVYDFNDLEQVRAAGPDIPGHMHVNDALKLCVDGDSSLACFSTQQPISLAPLWSRQDAVCARRCDPSSGTCPADITSFTASPTTVASGGASTLSWVSNASACGITAVGVNIGSLPGTGSRVVSGITAPKTYTLTCTGGSGTDSATLVITVSSTPPPTGTTIRGLVTCQLSGTPSSVGPIVLLENGGSGPQQVASVSVGADGTYTIPYNFRSQSTGYRYAIRPTKTTSGACIAGHTLENAYLKDTNSDGTLDQICSDDGYGHRGCENMNAIDFGYTSCNTTCTNGPQPACENGMGRNFFSENPVGQTNPATVSVERNQSDGKDYLKICVPEGSHTSQGNGFFIYFNNTIQFRQGSGDKRTAINPDLITGANQRCTNVGPATASRFREDGRPAVTNSLRIEDGVASTLLRNGANTIKVFPDREAGGSDQKISCKSEISYTISGGSGACARPVVSGVTASVAQQSGRAPSSTLTVQWNYNNALPVAGYLITRESTDGDRSVFKQEAISPRLTYTDQNVPGNKQYRYTVSANFGDASSQVCGDGWNATYAQSTPIPLYDAQGTFGTVTGGTTCTIQGWARDQDVPIQPIEVHVYQDGRYGTATGRYVTSAMANLARSDLATLWGADQSNHGFRIALPTSLKDGRAHQLYVYAINKAGTPGNVTEIWGSPKSITCTATTPTLVWVTFKARSDNFNTTVNPEITLITSTNSTPITKAVISSGALTVYTLQIPSTISAQDLRLAYLNDRYAIVNGVVQDSNVYVEDIRVNNMTYPNLTADGCQWNRRVGVGMYMACNGKVSISR